MSDFMAGVGSVSGPRAAGRGAMQRSERMCDTLLGEVERIAQLGAFVWNRGAPLYWSGELYRLLGYDPSSVSPSEEAFFAAVHPGDRERVRAGWAAACDGRLVATEYRIVRQHTQELRHVRATGQTITEAGEVQQIVGAVQDITEAKQRALLLEEARAVAKAAERMAGVGSFALRAESLPIAIDALVGASPPLAGVSSASEPLHPDDRERHARWWQQLASGAASEPLRLRALRSDGSVRYLETNAARVQLADGEERIIGTTLDITERVLLAERLEQVAKLDASGALPWSGTPSSDGAPSSAAPSSGGAPSFAIPSSGAEASGAAACGALSAGVAHDFNNYLLVLDQSLSMLLDSEGDERSELVASGRLALGRARELTRQLLALAHREPFHPAEVDVCRVVGEFSDLLERAVGRRARLCIEPSSGGLASRVDPQHVERMLTNLVVNAADAIEETRGRYPQQERGQICIRIVATRLLAPRRALPSDVPAGSYVCIEIDDDGGGIDAASLPHIFEPYYTTKAQGRGTGLGLASVFGMARRNGGQVSVCAVPGGTRFTLWLPRVGGEAAAPESSLREVCAASAPSSLEGPILLVIESDAVRGAMQRILGSAGFGTLAAARAREALELLSGGVAPRLIVADLELPCRGAYELCDGLQELASAPRVVFLSGYSESAAPDSGDSAEVLLARPFTPDRLIDFVQRSLRVPSAA